MSLEKSSPLALRWDREKDTAGKAENVVDVQALYEQADKDRREFAGAMAVMASLYGEGKGNELLVAIKVIETVSVRALAIAEIALKSAFGQQNKRTAEAEDERR